MPSIGFMSMGSIPGLGMIADGFMGLGIDIRSNRVPLQRSIQEVMSPSFAANFNAGGRPAWAPLTDATLATKQSQSYQYPPDAILMRTGTLFKTVQQLNIWAISRTEATMTLPDSVSYGGIHQAGSLSSNLPARPWAVFQPEDMDKIQEIFADWVLERALRRLLI